MKKRKLKLVGQLLLALSFSIIRGCTNTNEPQVISALDDKPFNDWFNKLLSQIKSDHNYKRIPINTTKKPDDFLILLHDT
ncbi:hypothetical protein ACTVPT_26060 [Serratia bockelmannii]|uniref:hypothetical protein n=1 Tax=Serratia TaxID=613 RepID=UPI00146E1004|nr:hypothetical protein [Serratia marcescens]NMT27211.1 hypothetical protein [Serratia marcescens]